MELGKVFKELDLKGDGVLDREEILAAAATAKKEEADAVEKLAKSMPKDFKSIASFFASPHCTRPMQTCDDMNKTIIVHKFCC